MTVKRRGIVLSWSRYFFSTKTPELYICSHAFIAETLPQWIIDTGKTKFIFQDKARFMEFHRYPVGSWTVVLGMEMRKISLE